jgi:hypothetical protein
VKGGQPARGSDEQGQEMNELIESDQEANAADIDENRSIIEGASSADEDD